MFSSPKTQGILLMRISKSIANITATFLLAFACMAQPALAQDFPAEADWRVTAYLWAVALEGEVGMGPITADVDLSFSDLLGALNIGGAVAIRRDWGRNVLVADLSYYSFSPDDVSTPLGGVVGTDLDMPLLSFYYGRKTALANGHAGWMLGARYMEMDTKLTWTPNLPVPVTRTRSASPDFTDFLVGGFYQASIGEKWDLNLQGDLGFGGSEHSLTVQMFFQRKLQSGNAISLGVRFMDVEFEDDLPNGEVFTYDALTSGLTLGFMWD
jgi:hypothetical protein